MLPFRLCVILNREGGFDISLYNDEPRIEIDYSMVPSRDRDGWGNIRSGYASGENMFFPRPRFLGEIYAGRSQEAKKTFDSWVEAWGKYEWFPCSPVDQQAKDLSVLWGKPAEGICRANSEYPEDNFWWDSQLRITPHFQRGIHYLEHDAHALAELDACRITRGGLFTDTGHSEMVQQFAKAYRTLPQQKFETEGETTDPVAVRTLSVKGKRYFYMVNREYYPVKVVVRFSDRLSQFTDLANSQKKDIPQMWEATLGPHELRSFCMSPKAEIIGFVATAPGEIISELKEKAERTASMAAGLQSRNMELPAGAKKLIEDIKRILEEGRYAWACRALDSYPVKKTELIYLSGVSRNEHGQLILKGDE